MDTKLFWAAVLLLACGTLLLVRSYYEGLVQLSGSLPWIPMLLGLVAIVYALVLLVRSSSNNPSS